MRKFNKFSVLHSRARRYFYALKKGGIAGGRAARLFPEKRETGCGAAAIAAACLAVAKPRRGAPRRFVEISGV